MGKKVALMSNPHDTQKTIALGTAKAQVHSFCAECCRRVCRQADPTGRTSQQQKLDWTKHDGRWVQHLVCPLPDIFPDPPHSDMANSRAAGCGIPDLSFRLESGQADEMAVSAGELRRLREPTA